MEWYEPENTTDGDTIQLVLDPEKDFVVGFTTITDTREYRTGVEFLPVQFLDQSEAPSLGAVFVLDDGAIEIDDYMNFIL